MRRFLLLGYCACVVTVLLSFATALTLGVSVEKDTRIHLRHGILYPNLDGQVSWSHLRTEALSFFSAEHLASSRPLRISSSLVGMSVRRQWVLLRFERRSIDVSLFRRLESVFGRGRVDYIPHCTYAVYSDEQTLSRALDELHSTSALLTWVGRRESMHKLSPSLVQRLADDAFVRARRDRKSVLGDFLRKFANDVHPSSLPGEDESSSIFVEIASHDEDSSVEVFSQQLCHAFREANFQVVECIPSGSSNILINCASVSDRNEIARELSRIDRIAWIESWRPKSIFNNEARSITQSGSETQSPFSSSLTGMDQIVAVGDSGLDTKSCFFYDADHPVSFSKSPRVFPATGHRKVAGYWSLIDDMTFTGGHGTHVAGSVAGNSLSSDLSSYNGMAPNAKILMTDCGCTNPNGCPCPPGIPCDCSSFPQGKCFRNERAIFLPLSLENHFFPIAKQNGAFIHTNSWGDSDNEYSIISKSIDAYAHKNPDVLIVFAAGNAGDSGLGTVSSEANAKNSLTVGASRTSRSHWAFAYQNLVDFDKITLSLRDYAMDLYRCYIYVNDSSCKFLEKFLTEEDCCSEVGQCASQNKCGCFWEGVHLGAICCKRCKVADIQNGAPLALSINSMASFSSRGPTEDGRIKPDVVAPGSIIVSAKSYEDNNVNYCGHGLASGGASSGTLQIMQGTSMATPVTAGNAALLREYLTKFYPNPPGMTSENAISLPSSSLMRAFLVASSVEMGGGVCFTTSCSQNLTMSRPFIQGFGRVTLNQIIPTSSADKRRSIVLSNENSDLILSTGGWKEFRITAKESSNRDLVIVLAWNDYPASLSAGLSLVTDLDLHAQTPSGTNHTGNEEFGYEIDFRNNIERVRIPNPQSGVYTIRVEAYTVPIRRQRFSLVASGDSIEIASTPQPKPQPQPQPEPTPSPTTQTEDDSTQVWKVSTFILASILGVILLSASIWGIIRCSRNRRSSDSSRYGNLDGDHEMAAVPV